MKKLRWLAPVGSLLVFVFAFPWLFEFAMHTHGYWGTVGAVGAAALLVVSLAGIVVGITWAIDQL